LSAAVNSVTLFERSPSAQERHAFQSNRKN
jgi:hypothetical protein